MAKDKQHAEKEIIILDSPFELFKGDKVEFVLGSIKAGENIKVEVKAHPYNLYELTIFPLEGKRTLLLTRIKGGSTLNYRAPLSCEAGISVKCLSVWTPFDKRGWLTISRTESSSEIQQAASHLRCPRCGMPLEPGAKYCGYCGAKVAE
jgi:DNA-directed RNA polymerase subunit RPC12/RpoP